MNCLRPGHFVKQCRSVHHCRKCQKPHHTLLHIEEERIENPLNTQHVPVSSSMASGISSGSLLMTCRVCIEAPDESTVGARALLDSASSASFISERLANTLSLPRSNRRVSISGIAGLSLATHFKLLSTRSPSKKFEVSAIIVPKVTCDLRVGNICTTCHWLIQLVDNRVESTYTSWGRCVQASCRAGGLGHLLLLKRSLVGC